MAAASKPVIYAALAGNGLIAITKFVAATITGSSAMLSEGIHSVVDTGNQVLLLFGLRQAKKPPDEQFPFGHGKEVYFWGFVVAMLIFAVGAGLSIYEGISHLLHPKSVENAIVNYVVLGLAMLFEGARWTVIGVLLAWVGVSSSIAHRGLYLSLNADHLVILGGIGMLLGGLTAPASFPVTSSSPSQFPTFSSDSLLPSWRGGSPATG